MFEDTMMIDLVTREGRVVGGLGLDIKTGEFIRFKTKAVVMATGGWHKAFWPNTGMRDLSGEGIAMAHRAGAEIGNMEFITFCCNVLLSPPVWRGSIIIYILGLLCGGELVNSEGETFLKKYDPYTVEKGTTMEWNKGFVSLATMREVREGKGSPNGGVYYGRGEVPWEEFERVAEMILPGWKYKAMDLAELARILKKNETVEVGPAVEYFEGGIVVNERFETGVEGLYAAGECTMGPFGSNRVCSAITEMLVHGADAGQNAGDFARNAKGMPLAPEAFTPIEKMAEAPLMCKEGLKPVRARRRVQEAAHQKLGPVRSKEELSSFIDFLEDIKKNDLPNLAPASRSRVYNKEWIDALELRNMIHLLLAASKSALFRTESRGVHYREDYPFTDNDSWLQENIVMFADGDFTVLKRPVTITSLTPQKGVTPFLEMLKKMMESRSDIGGHH
jgi:succinate dehydrogenase/fumarate reductase flavoprotein subunit